jgi:hypothetical protein
MGGRLPTRREALLAYVACAFPVNLWAFFHLLRVVPSFRLRLGLGDMGAIAAYNQALALVEGALLAGLVLAAGLARPARTDRNVWLARSVGVVWLAAAWMMMYHYFNVLVPAWKGMSFWLAARLLPAAGEAAVLNASFFTFLIGWSASFVLLLIGLWRRLGRQPQAAARLLAVLDRLVVLTLCYTLFDVAGALVVALRLWGWV